MPGECLNTNSAGQDAKFTYVSVDIDTTGKRLIDEIIQLCAYTPDKQFSQYIMPYMNLNQAAKMKHQVRVINLGIFRMLKNMQTHKVIKTKTEYVALKEFMDWLDELKAEKESKGVVLIFHEQRQFIPCMLLSALNRYDMMDRFSSIISGFGNNYWLAERKSCQPFKYLSLTQLAKMFLELNDEELKGMFEGNAGVRAKLAYDVFHYLLHKPVIDENGNTIEVDLDKIESWNIEEAIITAGEDDEDGLDHATDHSAEELKAMKLAVAGSNQNVIMNVAQSLTVLAAQQDVIKRQNSLRPLFVNYFRGKIFHRLLAVECRRSLAEHGYDMEKLQEIWSDKKMEGITTVIESLSLASEKQEELVKIIDAHFDPEKSPMKPARNNNHRRDFRNRSSKSFRPNASTNSGDFVESNPNLIRDTVSSN